MLKAPAWCGHAHPTTAGWEDPNTGEVLKSAKHTPAQIAEWHEARAPKAPAPAPVVQTLHEAPSVEREATDSEIVHHFGHHDDLF